ncbi:hypothetical protein JW916_12610 [Candidatus Sumerlaeota bacterium]|nr:hypothetical protein [Candidatus Sumerlaeota bacterium]
MSKPRASQAGYRFFPSEKRLWGERWRGTQVRVVRALAWFLLFAIGCASRANAGADADGDDGMDESLRIEYVARRVLGLIPDPRGETLADPVSSSSVRVRLTLNKPIYDLGEPIAARFSVTNIDSVPVRFAVGGDYRSGRPVRFSVAVRGEDGAMTSDPLWLRVRAGVSGGLGGEKRLNPGETWSRTLVLQWYANVRAAGKYTVRARYTYADAPREEAFESDTAAFCVLPRRTNMGDEALVAFQKENDLEEMHPSFFWGVRGREEDIPKLIQVMRTGTMPPGPPVSITDTEKRNAQVHAELALGLMPPKKAVYLALSDAIRDGVAGDVEDLFRVTFRTAVWPDGLDAVEEYLDDSSAVVRQLALETALSMGSVPAFERLPRALRSKDESMRCAALDGAHSYLTHTVDKTGWRLEGVTDRHVDSCRAILCTALSDEPSTGLLFRYVSSVTSGRGPTEELIQSVRETRDRKRRTALREALNVCLLYPFNPPVESPSPSLVELAREGVRAVDPDEKATGAILVAIVGDPESSGTLRACLSAPSDELRSSAALALLALGERTESERCIEILSRHPAKLQSLFLSRRWGISLAVSLFGEVRDLLLLRTGTCSEPDKSFVHYIVAIRRRVLELTLEARDDGRIPDLEVPEPSRNTGVCPADPTHQWVPFVPAAYSPFCPICGAKIETADETVSHFSPDEGAAIRELGF